MTWQRPPCGIAPFAVIACDVKMGFLDGVRLYHELEVEYPELRSRFFFISGVADDPEIAASIRQTGRPLLRKPFDLAHFLKLVQDVAAKNAPPPTIRTARFRRTKPWDFGQRP